MNTRHNFFDRTRLTQSVKDALVEILESDDATTEPHRQLDLHKFGISVTTSGDDSAQEGSGERDPFGVQISDDLFSVPEFGFTVDTTTSTTEEVPEQKGNSEKSAEI